MDQLLNRRRLLQSMGLGFGTLALAPLMNAEQPATGGQAAIDPAQPLAARPPHFSPKAKRVIHIFANGGPSHIDTFDHKPILNKMDGQMMPGKQLKTERPTGTLMGSPFKFKPRGESGIEVSELFENVGGQIDDICVIRSMYADVPNHEPSLMLMNTGEARQIRPSVGSWLTYGLGSENENLPAFISMCPGGYPIQESQNWQSGFLPGIYQGTYVDPQKESMDQLIENVVNRQHGPIDQLQQLKLLRQLNSRHQLPRSGDALIEARIQSFELAYRMQIEAADAFNISGEPKHIRELYGPGVYGKQLLIARRLAQRGVRFIQLWQGKGQPWDHHDGINKRHRKLCEQSDQPIAALLIDLKQHGLLEDTLVIWGGEFGRTPTVELPKEGANDGSKTGRDHNHYGFTTWMAGGGVRGGYVHGKTDEFGFRAIQDRVHVHDLHATILHLMGFDHEKLTFRYAGRDFRLTDVHGNVIHDIIA